MAARTWSGCRRVGGGLAMLLPLLLLLSCAHASSDGGVLDWIRASGGSVHGITIGDAATQPPRADVDGGGSGDASAPSMGARGVIATARLSNDTAILRVPLELLMTTGSGHDTLIGEQLQYLDHSPTNALALQLLHAARYSRHPDFVQCAEGAWPTDPAAEKWSPFVSSLPTQADMVTPLWYTPAEAKLIHGTSLERMARRRLNAARRSYTHIFDERLFRFQSHLFPRRSPCFSFDAWRWALSMVWSRVHMLVLDDHRGVEPVLVPGGDMFNAAPPSSAQESAVSFTTVDEQGAAKGHFEFRTTRDIDPGRQVFVPYAQRRTSMPACGELMLEYGVVPGVAALPRLPGRGATVHALEGISAALGAPEDGGAAAAAAAAAHEGPPTTLSHPVLCEAGVLFVASLPDATPAYEDKADVLDDLGIGDVHALSATRVGDLSQPLSPDLVVLARLAVMSKADFKRFKATHTLDAMRGAEVSHQTDVAAAAFLLRAIKRQQKAIGPSGVADAKRFLALRRRLQATLNQSATCHSISPRSMRRALGDAGVEPVDPAAAGSDGEAQSVVVDVTGSSALNGGSNANDTAVYASPQACVDGTRRALAHITRRMNAVFSRDAERRVLTAFRIKLARARATGLVPSDGNAGHGGGGRGTVTHEPSDSKKRHRRSRKSRVRRRGRRG